MVWADGQELCEGRYLIEKVLGQGGFGITYLARDNKGDRVAIKTLNDQMQRSDDFAQLQEDFMNEALKLAQFSHAHIVQVKRVIYEAPLWCMVMEYIDGENLASRGVLPEFEALGYIQQIGDALTVIHNKGLLHRDVKPQNILVRLGKSEAVLIDFGIAREFTTDRTQTHTALFTPFYAPPEQYNMRAKRGAYTDVYGLAATLYKLLTGKEPESAVSRLMGCTLDAPKQLNQKISDRVNQAILQGLALNSTDRPQSMPEFLALFPQAEEDDLSSDRGVDYRNLRNLLKTGQWKEADRETARVMLKVSGREEEGWLREEDIDKFPCTDLRTIDQLWVKYSNGRFGFSVQKRIYQSLGGTRENDEKIWRAFCDRVGWRAKGNWLSYNELTWNVNARLAHLPSSLEYTGEGWGFWRVLLLRRDL